MNQAVPAPWQPNWTSVTLATTTIPAKPPGRALWTLAADWIPGGVLLKIDASRAAVWAYSDTADASCHADGHPQSLLTRTRCLVKTAPVGALVGKIGGSSAGVSDGWRFVVGSQCMIRVPDHGGPLYLTINDEFGGMDNNAREMFDVRVFQSPAPP